MSFRFQHQTLRSSTRRSRRSCHDAAKRGQRSHPRPQTIPSISTPAHASGQLIAPGTVLNTPW